MPEVVEAVGRTFRAAVTYSGPAIRTVSGRLQGRTPDQVLGRLVDRTNLRFALDGSAWSVEEMGTELLRGVSLSAAAKSPNFHQMTSLTP